MSGRVALYAAPGALAPDEFDTLEQAGLGGALLGRAESWLGRSTTGAPVAPAAPAGWTRDAVEEITMDARRYGFHATLKAPFRLAPGHSLAALESAVAEFAAQRQVVQVPELALTRIGRFFALTPGAPAEPLYALAAEVVTAFDEFRAAPTEADLARRNPAEMTERRRELFERWGYPYVLDEFRFHLTLTDRIPPERQDEVEAALTDWFAAQLGRSIPIDCIAIFTESEPGAPFALHSAHPLSASAEPLAPTGTATATPATASTPRTTREGIR